MPRADVASPTADYVARLIAIAPPLTPEQRDRLALVLRPSVYAGGRAA